MATKLCSPAEVDLATSRRSLLLVWQNPDSRRFIKVGQLDVLAGWSVTAAAEQVNLDAPAHVRVLCRIDAQCL